MKTGRQSKFLYEMGSCFLEKYFVEIVCGMFFRDGSDALSGSTKHFPNFKYDFHSDFMLHF